MKPGDTFVYLGLRTHVVHRFEDADRELVVLKTWSRAKQRWRYFVEPVSLVSRSIASPAPRQKSVASI